MDIEKQSNYYLIRRKALLTEYKNIKKINSKNKVYSETLITYKNQEPPSRKLVKGDIIYIAESGVGIFAKAEVNETRPVYTISNSLDEIIGNEEHNIKKDGKYWVQLLSDFYKAKKEFPNRDYKLKYHKYFVEQTVLEFMISFSSDGLERIRKTQSGFIKLTDQEVESIKDPIINRDTTLKVGIPGGLRFKIHSLVNKNDTSSYWYDIDHLVPKSLGGPGNIIENLVPIGFSLNRHKNNSVPIEFLILSKKLFDWKFDSEIEKSIQNRSDNLVKLNSSKNLQNDCLQINEQVKKMKFEDAKDFYFDILKLKYPQLSEIYAENR